MAEGKQMIEFTPWPKIARLNRPIVITEKIDGTNSAIGVVQLDAAESLLHDPGLPTWWGQPAKLVGNSTLVYAQSRSRIISPGKSTDNHGFAAWVYDNAQELADTLGPGLHFGEWWGSGINRGYGLTKGEHRFSLFNTSRWNDETLGKREGFLLMPYGLGAVPILYQGEFSTLAVHATMEALRLGGSVAQPQFMRPEGVVVFHTASNVMFKATLENDEVPKEVAARRNLRQAA
jgi:RNA ligase